MKKYIKTGVGWTLTAIFASLIAVVLGWITGALTTIGASFATVIIGITMLVLVGFAMKMHPGKEDALSIISSIAVVTIVFQIFKAFGIDMFDATFNLSSAMGWISAIVVILFASVLSTKTAKAMKMG